MIVHHPLAHYAGSLFLNVRTIHHSWLGLVVGFLADYIYGAFWGIVFVYMVHWTGRRHLLLKGMIFGAFIWLFSFGGLRSLPSVRLREVVAADTLFYLFFHLVYGLALGWVVEKLGQWVGNREGVV